MSYVPYIAIAVSLASIVSSILSLHYLRVAERAKTLRWKYNVESRAWEAQEP